VTAYSGKTPLYMVASAPELDYNRRDLPPSVQYVGPCLSSGAGQQDVPDWLEALATRKRPVIHVTEGTVHLRKPVVLGAAAQGLGGMNADVIMTTGRQRDPASLDLGPLADNIRVESFVSHSALFPHTDVVITTGGAGTVLTALASGVPLIVVPTGWDLPESAQRVAECGAGVRIDPKNCTAESLRAAVDLLLNEPSYRENARRVGAALARQGGPARAAELLEQLAPVLNDD
ncbi:MAG: glycosyltransferase, partial [Anaerolineae bacterium]|nr:glycosyltransferase [Anaerolineae bacterium]